MTAETTISRDDREEACARSRRRIILRENLRGWGIVGPIILYLVIFTFIPLVILFR